MYNSQPSVSVVKVAPGYPPDPGGVETAVHRISNALCQQGAEVTVLAQRVRNSSAVMHTDLPTGGAKVHRYASWTPGRVFPIAPTVVPAIRRAGRRSGILHAHSYHSALPLLTALSTHQARARLVVSPHFHGSGHTTAARLAHAPYRRAMQPLMSRFDSVVCVSLAEAELFSTYFPRMSGAITVVPNGIDVAAIRCAQPFSTERPVLLVVGRLEPYKGVLDVVQSLKRLPEHELVIIGTGSQHALLKTTAKAEGVADRCRLLKTVPSDDLLRWYRTADCFISLSRHEAFAIAPREALAAGTPVVISDIPAHRELAAAVPGWAHLVTLDAAGLGSLPEQITSICRRPRHDAPTFPSWDDVGASMLSIYRSLL